MLTTHHELQVELDLPPERRTILHNSATTTPNREIQQQLASLTETVKSLVRAQQ